MISARGGHRVRPALARAAGSPYAVYASARESAPVFYVERFGFWVVTRHADVLSVLKDGETFSSRDALTSSPVELPPEVQSVLDRAGPTCRFIIDTDAPLHTRIRGLVTKAFTPRRVAAMAPTIERVASSCSTRSQRTAVRTSSPASPSRSAHGRGGHARRPAGRPRPLHEWSVHWLRLKQPGATLEQQLEWAESTVALQRYFMELLDDRERDPGDDLTSALLAAAREVDPP